MPLVEPVPQRMQATPFDTATLRAQVAAINWWHQIDLGHGIITPGQDRSAEKLTRLHLPADLHSKTVLDIGAWDGFFSFEAEKRGASRVVAVDHFESPAERWGGHAGFQLAHRVLNSKVQTLDADVHDLNPKTHGQFDLVLFLGVLYHLKDPLLALERVAAVTRHQLILETHIDMLWSRRPAIAFYPGGELKGDHTNWCGPNPAALYAMLRTVGFTRIETAWMEPRWRRWGRAVKLAFKKPRQSFWASLQQARIVMHAWK